MGRYYTIIEGNLYIFATGKSKLPDLNILHKTCGVFSDDQNWRKLGRIVVCDIGLKADIQKIRHTLSLCRCYDLSSSFIKIVSPIVSEEQVLDMIYGLEDAV